MKKLLFIFSLLLIFSCSSDRADENNTTTPSNGSGIGNVNFTYAGKTYNYTNYNYRDGGLIGTELINNQKPSLMWTPGTRAGSIYVAFFSGDVNGEMYNENSIKLMLYTDLLGDGKTSFGMWKGNGTNLVLINTFTNPKITYTTNNLNRISGTFTSNECSGSFSDIVRGN